MFQMFWTIVEDYFSREVISLKLDAETQHTRSLHFSVTLQTTLSVAQYHTYVGCRTVVRNAGKKLIVFSNQFSLEENFILGFSSHIKNIYDFYKHS